MSYVLVLCVILPLAATNSGYAEGRDERVADAEKVFEKYVKLGKAFDAKLAELYTDDAKITNLRKYPNGRTRTMSLTGKQYKHLIRLTMPLAKIRGDKSRFSDVKYAIEKDGVRIKASRYSELKKYTSPMKWLVRPTEKGIWLFVEESSESRP